MGNQIEAARNWADRLGELERCLRRIHPETLTAQQATELRRQYLEQIQSCRELALVLAERYEAERDSST